MHAEHADGQGVILIEGTLPHQRGGDRQLMQTGQLGERGMDTGRDRPASDVEERPLRGLNQIKGGVQSGRIRSDRQAESRGDNGTGLNGHVIERLLPDILGDVDQDRTGTA